MRLLSLLPIHPTWARSTRTSLPVLLGDRPGSQAVATWITRGKSPQRPVNRGMSPPRRLAVRSLFPHPRTSAPSSLGRTSRGRRSGGLGARLDPDDFGLDLLDLFLYLLDLVLLALAVSPKSATHARTHFQGRGETAHISFPINSSRPLTVASASALTCLSSTGPTSL